MLSEFSSGHICTCSVGVSHFHLDGTIQTHSVPEIVHQNLAVNLQLLHYGKIRFIILVPGPDPLKKMSSKKSHSAYLKYSGLNP